MSENGVVAVLSSPTREAQPATVETYDGEIRETYLNREDRLTFRVDDGNVECRFFENGRSDAVKQVTEKRKEKQRVVMFSIRSDGCTSLSEQASQDSDSTLYEATFADRTDGIKSIHLATVNRPIDIACESAQSLFRSNVRHVAIKFDPDVSSGKTMEVYQDVEARQLRIVAAADDFGHRTSTTFSNDVPTSDERYTYSKMLIMSAIQRILLLERELFVHLMPHLAHQDNAALANAHCGRLQRLTETLFAAFDELSGPVPST